MDIKGIMRKHSVFPPLLVLATNLAVSFATRLITSGGELYSIATDFDRAIPFLPGFIYIYFLAFAQWAVCFVAVMLLDDRASWRFCMAVTAGNLLSGIVFLVYPTVMTIRPEFAGGGAFTEFLGKTIFAADDPPMNIFPSIHCLHSWGVMRMLFAVKRAPVWAKISNAVFTVLVFLSVLFVKQHMLIDIPAGVLGFELGFLITKLTGVDVKLYGIRQKLFLKN